MKTDLQLAIEHLEFEVAQLELALEQFIADREFGCAEGIHQSLISINNQLLTLKCLENPNFFEIKSLRHRIKQFEIYEIEDFENLKPLLNDEQIAQFTENLNQSSIKTNAHFKDKLARLESIALPPTLDDDQLLSHLYLLGSEAINEIRIEIIKESVFAILKYHEGRVTIHLRSTGHSMSRRLVQRQKVKLLNMGYDVESFTKTIENYESVDKLKILEEITIICFEIFSVQRSGSLNMGIR